MENIIMDIHAHILPEMDDGAENWEESCAMLDIAVAMGIRTIIATPHYSRHLEVAKVHEFVSLLSVEVQKRCPEFRIYSGQELPYFDSIIEALTEGKALTLAGSRYVLVEFVPDVVYSKLYQGIRKILQGGYYPVLAHVERYSVLRQKKNMTELLETGCLLQMNYSSISGSILDKNVRWCRKQLIHKRIHLLGTDMHHRNRRSPVIDKSIVWLTRNLDLEYMCSLTRGKAEEILQRQGI